MALLTKAFSRKSTIFILGCTFCVLSLIPPGSTAESAQEEQGRQSRGRVWSRTTSLRRRFHKAGELIFADEFLNFDRNIWEHEITVAGKTNGEFQVYDDDPANSYVRDGILYIKPTTISKKYGEEFLRNGTLDLGKRCTDRSGKACKMRAKRGSDGDIISPIVSARINTRLAFAFRYGHMEVRAKLPAGDWIWPAIWLMPQGNKFGMWPQSGEIDIMESRGNKVMLTPSGEDIGCKQFGSTLHFGFNRTSDKWRLAHYARNDPEGFHAKFHNYGMLWTPDQIMFTLDDEVIGSVAPPEGGFWQMGNFTGPSIWDKDKISPFNQPFYIILNVAVGGTSGYFPDLPNINKPWKNRSPHAREDFWNKRKDWLPTWDGENAAMQIDYVRIWAL